MHHDDLFGYDLQLAETAPFGLASSGDTNTPLHEVIEADQAWRQTVREQFDHTGSVGAGARVSDALFIPADDAFVIEAIETPSPAATQPEPVINSTGLASASSSVQPTPGEAPGGGPAKSDARATNPGDIIVTGERPGFDLLYYVNDAGGVIGDGGGGFGTGGSSGGGSDDPDHECPVAEPNERSPEDIELDLLRQSAQLAAEKIAEGDKRWEWGSILFLWNGGIHSTHPVTDRKPDQISFNYTESGSIPDGAHIVGWVHSHPNGGSRPNALSDLDVDIYDTMTGNSHGRFTVDPNMMTYVIDNRTGWLHEFDQGDGTTSTGPVIPDCPHE